MDDNDQEHDLYLYPHCLTPPADSAMRICGDRHGQRIVMAILAAPLMGPSKDDMVP